MPSEDVRVLGAQTDMATSDGAEGQSLGDASGTASAGYDDSKVLERLDGILERFDSVEDALESLQTRDAAKSADEQATVSLDSGQYDGLTYGQALNLYMSVFCSVMGALIFGALLWMLFSRHWRF